MAFTSDLKFNNQKGLCILAEQYVLASAKLPTIRTLLQKIMWALGWRDGEKYNFASLLSGEPAETWMDETVSDQAGGGNMPSSTSAVGWLSQGWLFSRDVGLSVVKVGISSSGAERVSAASFPGSQKSAAADGAAAAACSSANTERQQAAGEDSPEPPRRRACVGFGLVLVLVMNAAYVALSSAAAARKSGEVCFSDETRRLGGSRGRSYSGTADESTAAVRVRYSDGGMQQWDVQPGQVRVRDCQATAAVETPGHNAHEAESCTTDPSVPAGTWDIFNTERACCSTNYPYSDVCGALTKVKSEPPTKYPTISAPDDDDLEIVRTETTFPTMTYNPSASSIPTGSPTLRPTNDRYQAYAQCPEVPSLHCKNGSVCEDGVATFGKLHDHLGLQTHESGFYCKCLPGYIGHECTIQVDDCKGKKRYNPSNPTGALHSCYHGSTCRTSDSGSYCDCNSLNKSSDPIDTK
ncbi:hypothetical protein THAOC_32369 [Thalassiosira oceanica]|uniref:EGF-like domain-containing protein n=1 Tax=Thalassiosira oceanica TaxID=159749 RepID=K0R662_THAOC|nr:hypothetical protein THAOC_32369 [Thalassiosira oceanica]|eukprot:EJK48803.1 hypothetical protein THAOC_32369 [Thalassiosira oceanica]